MTALKIGRTLVMLTIAALFMAIFSETAFAFKLVPCETTKKKFDAMAIPASTPIALIIGHEFRKADKCVPVEINMKWTNHYKTIDHNFYDMEAAENYPGELWYRTDREEFVIVANGKAYSGDDRLASLKSSGEGCNHSYDAVCDMWTPYGTGSVKAHNAAGSSTGALQYGYPTVITHEEEIPEAISIIPPHFEFYKHKDSYWRPPMVDIDNLSLFDESPIKYGELLDAMRKKKTYSKQISWKHNEKVDETPTHHEGNLSMRISFDPKCPTPFTIAAPEANKKYLFSSGNPGKVTIEAEAVAEADFPPELLEEITWSAPEKTGSHVTYEPETRKGKKIKITYEGLPEKNSDFGPTAITASVNVGSKCGVASDKREVLLFFPRDEKNNPAGDVPNYYYYWLQTPAGFGQVNKQDVFFKNRELECGENPKWLGYHPRDTKLSVPSDPMSQPLLVGKDFIYLCDFHKYDNGYAGHPSTNFYMEGLLNTTLSWEGIDTFAVMVRHEATHKKHWQDWWNPTGGYPKGGFYDANNNKQRDASEAMRDRDEDFIPDSKEPPLSYDPTENNTFSVPGDQMFDEHHLTYDFAEKWAKGSADKKDWAKPGKQWE